MPYLGNVPAENYAQVSYQDLTGGSGTSFTLDYPVGSAGEIEVFVNNVRQEPTVAYTVNGTALTMTGSVAATDDFYIVFQGKAEKSGTIPEKQSDGTYVFPDDVTVSGNITSTGIDDNATSTAMTLNSSGNLLVGRTTSGTLTVAGSEFQAGGAGFHVRDNGTPLYVGRKTSDGNLVEFSKDGSTVGSIKSRSSGGNLQIDTVQSGIDFAGDGYLPMRNGSITDNTLDIGSSSFRYKDLYLSGGVYVGGTGSANYLDDYEEGTWTPASNHGTVTYNQAIYTKIGRLVTLNLNELRLSNTTTAASITISGLPFSVNSNGSTGAVMMRYSGSTVAFTAFVTASNQIFLYQSATTASWVVKQYADFTSASNDIYLTVTYLTA